MNDVDKVIINDYNVAIMARPYRIQIENGLYHITSRGNQKKKIFSFDSDYCKFLEYLLQAKEKYGFYVYAYVLMPNHYHLLIETPKANLSKLMHYLNTSYTIYYNKRRRRVGHLFQGRYKSLLVEKDSYFLELTRYIHNNPLKAKLVESLESYQWSSYKVYMKQRVSNKIVDKVQLSHYFDMSPKEYNKFLGSESKKKEPITDKVYAGMLLGKKSFMKEMLEYLKDEVESEDWSYRREIKNTIGIDEIVKHVGKYYGIETKEIYRTKGNCVFERKVAIYLCKRIAEFSNKNIGAKFGITYSAVSKAYKDISLHMLENKKVKKDIHTLHSLFKG